MSQSGAFTVRDFRISDGGRFCILIRNDTGFPVVLVARYLATEVWGQESENTTRSRLNAIKAFYKWGLSLPTNPFDPDIRLCEPDAIDKSDITSFALYLRSRRRHKVLLAPGADKQPDGKREVVRDHTVALYLTHVADYVAWAADTQARPKMAVSRIDKLREWFRDKIKDYQKTGQPKPKGLAADQQRRLREICHPDSPDNPFNKPVRYRNHAIILLTLNAPFRRGELGGLRMEDINLHGGGNHSVSVVVQDTGAASTLIDRRKHRPRQKTLGRQMPISGETKDSIVAYLRHERPSSARTPFVFLESRCGRPMTLSAIYNVFRRLLEVLGDEIPELYPHLMRHTFNYNFKLHNLEKGWPDQKLKQVQNHLNGWKDTSEQSALYGSAANIPLADHYVSEMQKKLTGRGK